MGKTLRNLVGGVLIAGSLLLPSCGVKKAENAINEVMDTTKNVPQEITGIENAYDQALDIYKNPGKYAIGERSVDLDAVKQESKIEQVLVEEKGLEWYFLQGKELNGLVVPKEYRGYQGIKNPDIVDKELLDSLFTHEGFYGMGRGAYMPIEKQPLEGEYFRSGFEIDVYQFNNPINALNFLNTTRSLKEFTDYSEYALTILGFIKGNITPLFFISNRINIEEEKTYLNSLINYQKRTGINFYIQGDQEGEELLGIPLSESGEYFRKAAEFQRDLYNMSEEELRIFELENFVFPIKKLKEDYQKNTISKEEIMKQASEFGKEWGRKFIFILPNLNKQIDGYWILEDSLDLIKDPEHFFER